MVKSNPVSTAVAATSPADDKWRQQVRLACVQAASARAVASIAAYNADDIIRVAKDLATFVINGD